MNQDYFLGGVSLAGLGIGILAGYNSSCEIGRNSIEMIAQHGPAYYDIIAGGLVGSLGGAFLGLCSIISCADLSGLVERE